MELPAVALATPEPDSHIAWAAEVDRLGPAVRAADHETANALVKRTYYCCVTSEANLLILLDNPGRVSWPEKAIGSRI